MMPKCHMMCVTTYNSHLLATWTVHSTVRFYTQASEISVALDMGNGFKRPPYFQRVHNQMYNILNEQVFYLSPYLTLFRWSKENVFYFTFDQILDVICPVIHRRTVCGICSQSHGAERYWLNLEAFKFQLTMITDRLV